MSEENIGAEKRDPVEFPSDIEKIAAPKRWHRQHEKVLQEWGEAAACYR